MNVPKIHPKLINGVIVGACTTLLVWAASALFHYTLPVEVAGAIVTLAFFAAGYQTSNPPSGQSGT